MSVALNSTRVNVTIPKKLKEFIADCVATGEYATPSDYVRTLIRSDRQRKIDNLNNLLQEGLDSGISNKSPKEIFASARREIATIGK